MFCFFKRKEKITLPELEIIKVKYQSSESLYTGKFVSITAEEGENDIYYDLYVYDNQNKPIKVSKKIPNKYYNLCKEYGYGIVKNIDTNELEIAVIKENGYIKKIKLDSNLNVKNGEAFIIKENNVYKNGVPIFQITNFKVPNYSLNCYENGYLLVFIKK